MTNKSLQEIASTPDKKIGESTNILARLYRRVLMDLNVDYNGMSTGIQNYLNNQQRQAPRSQKEQSREKGNLVKELTGDSLTWKNFIKGLMVLNPVSAELKLTLRWRRGEDTVHTVEIVTRNIDTHDYE